MIGVLGSVVLFGLALVVGLIAWVIFSPSDR